MSVKFIPLEQACDFLSGYAWSAANFQTDPVGIPIIRIQNVDSVRESDFVYWDGPFDDRFVVRNGDLLLTLSGSFRVVVWEGPDALLNQRIVKLIPKKGFTRDWLLYVLRNGLEAISGMGRHALVSNVALADLRLLKIPFQTAEEQRRIAAILDQAETLRTQRRTALALLDSLTQSLFLDMFGEGESYSWPVTSIGKIVDEENGGIRTGPFGSQLLHSEFVDEGVAVLGIDNAVNNDFRWGERRYITHAKYEELKRYTVRPGDVLITIMGTCGRCAVVPDDIPLAINTKHLCCISVDRSRVVPDYLHAYFLRHPTARKYLEQTAKGAIMSGLNMGIIKAMPIALPPLPLQQTFATRIASIEALKATHRRALAALDALFASLQQRAFAGQLVAASSATAPRKSHRKAVDNVDDLRKLEGSLGLEALIFVAKRTAGNDVYAALKTLYVADKRHLEHHGRLIYGETYSALEMGPVPEAAYEAVKFLRDPQQMFCAFGDANVRAALQAEGNKRLIPLRDADLNKLGAEAVQSLEAAIRYFANSDFGQVKTVTHDSAYERTPKNQSIPMRYIIDMLPAEALQRHWNL